jgi:RNA polymerase sigma factor (sigma-70 family)
VSHDSVPWRSTDAHARFEALFTTHIAQVHKYVLRRSSPNDVDDLVADVFLTAWRKLDDIPPGFELPWLYRTSWNVMSNARRKHQAIPLAELPEVGGQDIADSVINDQELARAWLSLGVRDREILRLSAWEGLSGEDLASTVGLTVGSAASALSRARARLSAALAQ